MIYAHRHFHDIKPCSKGNNLLTKFIFKGDKNVKYYPKNYNSIEFPSE